MRAAEPPECQLRAFHCREIQALLNPATRQTAEEKTRFILKSKQNIRRVRVVNLPREGELNFLMRVYCTLDTHIEDRMKKRQNRTLFLHRQQLLAFAAEYQQAVAAL